MTLNVMWSDPECSYLIVDSARTHSEPPQFENSLLGQAQRRSGDSLTVEEGVQKIVPLAPDVAVGLCGSEIDVLAVGARLRNTFRYQDGAGFLAHLQALPESATVEVSLAIAGGDPAFMAICHPKRELFEVHRTHMHATGSLTGEPRRFLFQGIERFLLGPTPPFHPEMRLVVGLAFAMTMSVQYSLTDQGVGGAFFGARLDETAFHWQPDIVYVLYDPTSFDGLPTVVRPDAPVDFSKVKNSDSRVDQIACLVRADSCLALSTIGKRGVAAWSSILVDDVRELERRLPESLPRSPFTGPGYFAFIPKVGGAVVVVANDGQHLQVTAERIAFTDALGRILQSRDSDGRNSLTVVQGGQIRQCA